MGIKAQWIKPWTTTTRDSGFSNELLSILDEQFNPERPNAVWCTDITYIWTQDGFVYLNCVMGLFARKIICWELKIEKLCFDKYCTCFGRTGYIQSFVPKNSMEFLIILVEKFGLK